MCPSTCICCICVSCSPAEWCGGDYDHGGEEAEVTWFPQVEETLAFSWPRLTSWGALG